MNLVSTHLMGLDISVAVLALGVLLLDLWMPAENRSKLAYVVAAALGGILIGSLIWSPYTLRVVVGDEIKHFVQLTASDLFVMDDLALFFKRFFLVAAILVVLMSVGFWSRVAAATGGGAGGSEFYSLTLFALVGMLLAASANDFTMLFVSIELITVSFYVLTSFQRTRLASLEAGVKYLILGGLSSAVMVYGIALIYGTVGSMGFVELSNRAPALSNQPIFLLGLLMVIAGLGFKIAAFPMQVWAPDVYQGSPAPATAFLAVGSKAAGFVLLLRLLMVVLPHDFIVRWNTALLAIAAITILYGSLCAIPQRNLKRLLGYSSIANAGYMLLGVAALSKDGAAAVLYYLAGYLFTVIAAFTVLAVAIRATDAEDIATLGGLGRRSPFLAAAMTLSMVSLAGIPPLAGFFGKFLLFKAAVDAGPAYYWAVAVAIVGVVISIYYYFGVIRAIYWGTQQVDAPAIEIPLATRVSLGVCVAGMLFLGVYPASLLRVIGYAVETIH
jgi:NADH-quinone oxidoreductase subunit N